LKKKIFLLSYILTIILSVTSVYATQPSNPTVGNGYGFEINYTGNIIEDEDKNATVVLEGTNATPYTNVRIKVDFVSGPSTPTIIAYDTNGIGYNIVEFGYWGPEAGFAVGGTFRNETPILARYLDAGTYVVRLSLVDVNNNEAIITSKEFTQTVLASTPTEDVPVGNTVVNNTVTNNIINNTISEIPQTGVSIWVYIGVILVVIIGIYIANKFIKKN